MVPRCTKCRSFIVMCATHAAFWFHLLSESCLIHWLPDWEVSMWPLPIREPGDKAKQILTKLCQNFTSFFLTGLGIQLLCWSQGCPHQEGTYSSWLCTEGRKTAWVAWKTIWSKFPVRTAKYIFRAFHLHCIIIVPIWSFIALRSFSPLFPSPFLPLCFSSLSSPSISSFISASADISDDTILTQLLQEAGIDNVESALASLTDQQYIKEYEEGLAVAKRKGQTTNTHNWCAWFQSV